MTDGDPDDRFKTLFSGRAGTVLGAMKDPPTLPDSKLTRTKRRWAEDRHQPRGGPSRSQDRRRRLPPGQSLTGDWPVLDLGVQPLVPTDQWTLTILGAVERPTKLDWAAMMDLPQVEKVSDIHCVTAWSMFDARWSGVPIATLLDLVRPDKVAAHVVLHSHDGYRTNLPMARFAHEASLLAHSWNGTPLAREHGGPLRAVVPSLYFWKSAKWLRQITFLDRDAPGYWETRGYHNLGDPWKEQRYG